VQVEAPLRFDAHYVTRFLHLVAESEPDIVVLSGRASTSDNDFQWASVIADELDPPTVLALNADQPRTGPVNVYAAGTHAVNVYAAVKESRYESVPGLNLYAATGVPITNDEPLVLQPHLKFNVTADALPGLTDVLARVATAKVEGTVTSEKVIAGGPLTGIRIRDIGGPPEQPRPADTEAREEQLRYVNTMVHRADDGTAVKSGEAMAEGTDYRLGIGIGAERKDSLLAGKAAEFPDKALPERRGRRVTIYVQKTTGPDRKRQRADLYLPTVGSAFTCPLADEQPAGTDWDSFSHTTCAADHRDLAEFALPRLVAGESVDLEALLYVGAAALHRQQIQLSTDPNLGTTAEVTFRLVESFDKLPDLTDRVVSIAEGSEHLTINGVDKGVFTFMLSGPQWSGIAFRFRTALTNLYFEKRKGAKAGYVTKYPLGKTRQETFVDLLGQLAKTGSELFDSVFPGPDNSGLFPMLRSEAKARQVPVVIQVARTIQRPFVLPWQIVYDLPLSSRVENPQMCESLKLFGPDGDEWPPPTLCPYADEHPTEPDAAVLCPWGFWGLAHLLEVPDGTQKMDEVVADTAGETDILAAAGANLDTTALTNHFATLHDTVPGFPARHLSEAGTVLKALADPTDVVYMLCHGKTLTGAGEGTALIFSDGEFTSYDVGKWSRVSWGQSHWKDRRPLVILNACRTAEIVQSTLSEFVSMFALAGAAGVVGTETFIDQPTAEIAMQHFLEEFIAGATASEALRYARWRLLGLGSLLGLTYSPYCSATLRLRAVQN
jgi:hypothetical protein